MRYYIRNALPADCDSLYRLACQANLLNLPADKKLIGQKIEKSLLSFSDEPTDENSLFMFVLEDWEKKKVIGTSLIISQYASESYPHYYFQIKQKGKIQVLRLGRQTGGISAIGGLVLDKNYRGNNEKLGKQISLIRMLFIGMFPEKFEKIILSELMPLITNGGFSAFWEELGQKFTNLTYKKAIELTRKKQRDFIWDNFPKNDIILPENKKYLHRYGDSVFQCGQGEKYIIKSVGFRFENRIDPMDGALHYTVKLKDITIAQKGKYYNAVAAGEKNTFRPCLIGIMKNRVFKGCMSLFSECSENKVYLPKKAIRLLEIEAGDKVYISPMD